MRESGLDWTLVRPWEFQSNTLDWAPSVRAGGVVRVPALGKPSPAVAPADIAAVSARALVEDGHAGAVYPLTGPAELTVEDKVRVLGEVLGRPVSLVVAGEVPAHDDPVVRAALVSGVCGMDSPGVLPTVAEVTGRPAHAYVRWAMANAAAFSPA
ncbi:Rossmann-fold NAD(P)-binding domain-containing protein [Actinophytocola sp. KF-1]